MPKILVVEDNEMNRDMLSRRLKGLGYSVVIATDGEGGHAMATSQLPDLILMDIGLPGVDGLHVTRLLKSSEATRNIPILVLTAQATIQSAENAFEAGCDDFATKPVAFAQLHKMIEKLLSRSLAADRGERAAV